MEKMKLIVNVDARFDWMLAPETMQEKAMREHADILAKEAANKLNAAVTLLVAEFLASTKI